MLLSTDEELAARRRALAADPTDLGTRIRLVAQHLTLGQFEEAWRLVEPEKHPGLFRAFGAPFTFRQSRETPIPFPWFEAFGLDYATRVLVIGRTEPSDFVLFAPGVSRRHMGLTYEDGTVFRVRDLGSASGFYVNNQRANETVLQDGDVVMLGGLHYVFRLGWERGPLRPRDSVEGILERLSRLG